METDRFTMRGNRSVSKSQESMMPTNRPVALVTGASSGIGKETALALVAAGFDVAGTSRDTSRVSPLDGVSFLDLDVASDASVTTAVQQVIERFGRIDVLVNNAGVGSMGAAEETSVAQAQGVFDTNVFGVMRMVNEVLPHMRAQGRGRIINISSVLGFLPQPYMAVYAASKHAIEGYTESWTTRSESTASGRSSSNRLHQDRIRGQQCETRHAPAGLRAAAADRRPRDGRGDQGRRRPTVVAKAIVAAATDARPKLRYTAGPMAGRASTLRESLPPGPSTSRSAR
ncbi:SDR family NAD(P)-dependent oxidoreductase [Streptomyces coeruleorubidus]|uniref:SDR family NAD(P)-dependent oxidoreductase n=1 Tax=Streptomyces coeruleorubidus TaxID=116188 RepID=UPI003158D1E4